MTEENELQPSQRVNKTLYLPHSQTATLTDSNNNETVIRNISQEAFNEVSDAFLASTVMTTSNKSEELSKSRAASEPSERLSGLMESGVKPDDKNLSSLVGAGVSEKTKSKDQK